MFARSKLICQHGLTNIGFNVLVSTKSFLKRGIGLLCGDSVHLLSEDVESGHMFEDVESGHMFDANPTWSYTMNAQPLRVVMPCR